MFRLISITISATNNMHVIKIICVFIYIVIKRPELHVCVDYVLVVL